ncbi:PadR family transcriptional regulator [Marinactinospora thermotolerans]|uniref:Transcriptional regulator, PadR family n=1 Tax=Marinactinospora thermotolerans DSM 45154 TaxID=1122192 RepID=A0A1T4THJ9_9ACTN|nr:PadR family transcriptional regulator [Marinactinospora thermotolerans]SKA39741.1 transcriptional regulator, PadR family [Marinactinospora thermotolerans DSM 45154]
MSLRHAILGILSIQPMSGYDLKKVIDESVGHFWSADQSQVYRTLAGLVEDGLATRRTVVQEERPNLHLHSPTDLGLAELDRWLTSPLKTPPTRDPFLARLFFADRLPPEEIRGLLETRRREVGEQLAALEAIAVPAGSADDLGRVLRLATLSYGISQARAELDWLDDTRRRLERITS